MRSLLVVASTFVVLSITAVSAQDGAAGDDENFGGGFPEGQFDHPAGNDARHSLYGDGLSEDKATCNVCTEIIVPALDDAIFNSTPGEHWAQFVEDIVHNLPSKYRYDIENHEVVEHNDEKHGTDPCAIVSEQVHAITLDPHTHASVAALAHMYHSDDRVKSHLKRMAIHTICPCIDDITKDDGEFNELLSNHMHATDRLQHQYDLHHDEYEHGANVHEHLSEPKEDGVKELSKKELEEMQWEEEQERHSGKEHGDHQDREEGSDGGDLHGEDQNLHGLHGLKGDVGAPQQEGDDRGDHDLNLEGLGIGHGEL